MSRRGDCHDTAVMEAFFSTMKGGARRLCRLAPSFKNTETDTRCQPISPVLEIGSGPRDIFRQGDTTFRMASS